MTLKQQAQRINDADAPRAASPPLALHADAPTPAALAAIERALLHLDATPTDVNDGDGASSSSTSSATSSSTTTWRRVLTTAFRQVGANNGVYLFDAIPAAKLANATKVRRDGAADVC